MNSEELLTIAEKAGLTSSQAKVYIALIKEDELTPAQMAKATSESRENCYSVAKRLVELGLAEKTDNRKATYRALNPSALQTLAENRRRVIQRNEAYVKQNLDSLLNLFYANSEMPGAHTIEGIEGIREVYNDMAHTKEDIYLLRTPYDHDLDEQEFTILRKLREKRNENGITTYALTPDEPLVRQFMADGTDEKNRFDRVIYPEGAYTGKVEIDIYGDKVVMIAFGETQMATVISSPAIAESLRQILTIMRDFYRNSYPQRPKS